MQYEFKCNCGKCSRTDKVLSKLDENLEGFKCRNSKCNGALLFKDSESDTILECNRCGKTSSEVQKYKEILTFALNSYVQLRDYNSSSLDDSIIQVEKIIGIIKPYLHEYNSVLFQFKALRTNYYKLKLVVGLPIEKGTEEKFIDALIDLNRISLMIFPLNHIQRAYFLMEIVNTAASISQSTKDKYKQHALKILTICRGKSIAEKALVI